MIRHVAIVALGMFLIACHPGSQASGAPTSATSATSAPRPAGAADPGDDGPVYFHADSVAVGDPNPAYVNGAYVIFYLRNEGRHPLWMSQSKDLITWSKPQEALPAGSDADHDFWIGSGSVIAGPTGGYRLYYTGHNPALRFGEVVMSARAPAIGGPWTKDAERPVTVSAPPGSSTAEFRDPFVWQNPQTRRYQMLVSGRSADQALIERYESADLRAWAAKPPLYVERSPLNLEVPEIFGEGGQDYLLFSDQRDRSRQVRYRSAAHSDGPFRSPAYDALDGRNFYAGKTAGTGEKRVIFGWVPAKRGARDDGTPDWGGNLVYHALRRTVQGDLAVALPAAIRARFTHVRSHITGPGTPPMRVDRPLFISIHVTAKSAAAFGIRFTAPNGIGARMRVEPRAQRVMLILDRSDTEPPAVRFPRSPNGTYKIDMVLDPGNGLGVAYINDFRALSFRYYGLSGSDFGFFAEDAATAMSGNVLARR